MMGKIRKIKTPCNEVIMDAMKEKTDRCTKASIIVKRKIPPLTENS